jgi:hypothetical protein
VVDSGIRGSAPVESANGVGNITRTVDILPTNATGFDALVDLIANPNGFYVNLHTSASPGGHIRSQLLRMVDYASQIAGGGDWTTSIRLSNPSATSSVHGVVLTTADGGKPIGDAVIDPALSFWIPPSGAATFDTSNRGTLATGYARVQSDAAVTVETAYVMPGLGGSRPVASTIANAVSIPVSLGGGRDTGIALLSLEDAPSTLLLTLKDAAGAVPAGGTGLVAIAAGGRLSQYVSQLLPGVAGTTVAGTLTIEMTRGPIPSGLMAVVALRFESGSVAPATIKTIP